MIYDAILGLISHPSFMMCREVSEHESRSSGKKKVTSNLNVTTYVYAELPDQEEEAPEDDEKHTQKSVVLPKNHCHQNCSDSHDDVEDSDEEGILWTAKLVWLMRRN